MAAGPETSAASFVLTPRRQEECEPALPDGAGRIGGLLTLRDGRRAQMRAIRPDDGERLAAFHARLSPETTYLRYCGMRPALSSEEALRRARVDYAHRMAVVATSSSQDADRIIAVVEYERIAPATAEVSFVVEDGWQGLGIGTCLLYALAGYAREQGIVTLTAYVLSRNRPMLGVLRHSGFPYAEAGTECGCVEVHLDISRPPAAW